VNNPGTVGEAENGPSCGSANQSKFRIGQKAMICMTRFPRSTRLGFGGSGAFGGLMRRLEGIIATVYKFPYMYSGG